MKVQIMSDIHTEFHDDLGLRFILKSKTNVNVLILAGDIGTVNNLDLVLPIFADNYKDVIFVAGNHEYYGSSREAVHMMLNNIQAKHKNFHFLNNDICNINGRRFVGTTLWFADTAGARANQHLMNDFYQIKNFTNWVYQDNSLAHNFLKKNVCKDDIVITHHLPSNRSVSPEYENSLLNAYFVSPADDVIVENRPAVWAHGHTHDSFDYMLEETRVVCNPYGYERHETNSNFANNLVIDI